VKDVRKAFSHAWAEYTFKDNHLDARKDLKKIPAPLHQAIADFQKTAPKADDAVDKTVWVCPITVKGQQVYGLLDANADQPTISVFSPQGKALARGHVINDGEQVRWQKLS